MISEHRASARTTAQIAATFQRLAEQAAQLADTHPDVLIVRNEVGNLAIVSRSERSSAVYYAGWIDVFGDDGITITEAADAC